MTDQAEKIGGFRELLAWIRQDYRANGRSVFYAGFQAMAVHRLGVWHQGLRPTLARVPFALLYAILNIFVRNVYGIEIHATTRIGRRVQIAHQHGIVLHPRCIIGDGCLIRQGVTIGQAAHIRGPQAAPRIGSGVLIGAGAIIMGDITVGDDVVIGPNAVVMTSVPAGCIVTAPPARIIPRPGGGPAAAPITRTGPRQDDPPSGVVSSPPTRVVATKQGDAA